MTEHAGLSPAWVAQESWTVDELLVAEGKLWWLQSDPDRGGIRRVVRAGASGKAACVTPDDLPVGNSLHAYGGGCFAVTGTAVWFTADGSLFHQPHGGTAKRVAHADGRQLGDLTATAAGGLLAVRGGDAADEIVLVSEDGSVEVLVSSTGFLGHPRLRETRLCFTEWDRDRMPWDACRVVVSDTGEGTCNSRVAAGGRTESAVQPEWGPDGRLYFVSDRTGWWNLYRLGEHGAADAVAPIEADCAPPPWEAGYRSYAVTGQGEIVLTVTDGISSKLMVVDEAGGRRRIGANLTSIKPYLAEGIPGAVAVIGSTAVTAPSVWLADLGGEHPAVAHAAGLPDRRPGTGRPVRPTAHSTQVPGAEVRFLLHRPANSGSAPLLVRAHPGPTDGVPMRLDWTTQFFVSHGFAVAEPLYRGSTGQGRPFRQQLDGHWGERDVDDCIAVAERLVARGVARPGALFISGASAGGYTALQAACRSGAFTAATAISAITDPARWERTVPAWQRPHASALRGPAGAVRPERVRCPVLVVHGSADTITSADDAMDLAGALAQRGLGTGLLLEGGDHYLSNPRDREAALAAELAFYREVMLRPAAGGLPAAPRA
ncbi:prolyl oligopeptidase family serine peptidase [Kitasatospora griseola]